MQHIPDIGELRRLLSEGEALEHRYPNLELKQSWSQEYGKKISKLANTVLDHPSWLVIGVDDKGSPTKNNEDWAKKTELRLSNHVRQYLEPLAAYESCVAERIGATQNWVLIVKLRNPGVVVRWNGHAFGGAGTGKTPLSPSEAMGLQISLPGRTDWTAQPSSADFNPDLVLRFARRLEARSDEPAFHSITSKTPDEVLSKAEISGTRVVELLFGATSFRLIKVEPDGSISKNLRKKGLLDALSEDTLSFIQTAFKCESPFPETAIKEAIANAVAHAAHYELNGDIIVEVHQDFVSIQNLCDPAALAFANRWFSRQHLTQNPALMEALRLAGFVDELGRGKTLIMKSCLQHGSPPPIVESEPTGHLMRWKTKIHARSSTAADSRLFERVAQNFDDEAKAVVATALVYWHMRTIEELKDVVDERTEDLLMEVIASPSCPLFVNPADDTLLRKRWVNVLLGEGKDSKQLSQQEEDIVLVLLHSQFGNDREFRPIDIRRFAQMENTASERALTQTILKRWQNEGKVERTGHGKYLVSGPPRSSVAKWYREYRESFEAKVRQPEGNLRRRKTFAEENEEFHSDHFNSNKRRRRSKARKQRRRSKKR